MGLISFLFVARRGARDYDAEVDEEVKQKFFGA